MEEILESQLLIRGQSLAMFAAIEEVLAGCKKSFYGPHVVQAWSTLIMSQELLGTILSCFIVSRICCIELYQVHNTPHNYLMQQKKQRIMPGKSWLAFTDSVYWAFALLPFKL